jgi:hypothetical protein
MEINPMRVMIEAMFGSLIAHEANPMATSKNENSLICPRLDQARKLFFLVCHMIPRINMMMIGLMMRMKRTKQII